MVSLFVQSPIRSLIGLMVSEGIVSRLTTLIFNKMTYIRENDNCYFCKTTTHYLLSNIKHSSFYICLSCWNKLPKSNGIFDSWALAYEFQSKALTKKDLKVLKQEDSSFIFNRFLEILRHNVVSDKPNAFNKIFTLFLCKIIDEDRNDDEQLHFQWITPSW